MPETTAHLEELDALDALLEADSMPSAEIDSLLNRLESSDAPEAVLYRLRLLLTADRLQDAAALARSLKPDQLWCEHAIRALALVGDSDAVRSLVDWARSNADLDMFQRSVEAAAAGLLEHQFADRSSLPSPLDPDDIEALHLVQEILSGLILGVEARQRVRTPVEMRATVYALRVSVLLGDRLRVQPLASLLLTYQPASIDLAHLAISGAIACPEVLPSRLKLERPESFDAQLAAVLLLDECQGIHSVAFDNARSLIPMAAGETERRDLAAALVQIGQHQGANGLREAKSLAKALLPSDDPLLPLVDAAIAIAEKDALRAEQLLQQNIDDENAYWHQLDGQVKLLQNRANDAVEAFRRAAALLPHPALLKQVSSLAASENRGDVAITLLKEVTKAHPEDLEAKRRLGELYLSQRNYPEAIHLYRMFIADENAGRAERMNLAYALTMTNQLPEAIAEYDVVCATPDPPLAALVARAQLHHTLGDPKRAFELVADIRDDNWTDYRFVGAYMQIAYAAGEDTDASSALAQLKVLQDQGKTDTEVLRAASLDDLLEHAREYNKQTRMLSGALVRGRVPWICADAMLRRGPCWAWTIRTQPRSWIREDPVDRAQLSVYCTNGLTVHQKDVAGRRKLDLIEAAPGPVAIDITALLTLSKLGVLGDALTLFGEVYFPTVYLEQAVEDATRLVDHQASRRDTATALRREIDAHRVRVVDDSINLPLLDEYIDGEEVHPYRLIDLLALLESEQLLPAALREAVQARCQKQSGITRMRPPLRRGQRIRVDLVTLEMIANVGILEATTTALVPALSVDDQQRLVAEIYGYEHQDQVRVWHTDLWSTIRGEPNMHHRPTGSLAGFEEAMDEPIWRLGLASTSLSHEMGIPLVADDRVIQALSHGSEEARSSFGSDVVVRALFDKGIIDRPRASSLLLDLMKWRYRFLLPAPEDLKEFADQFQHSLPGHSLRLVAQYVHDCMRDVGLFAGFEATDPPSTMADRVYQHWVYVVAEFLGLVWLDEPDYSVEQASVLTHWALTELLPSVPVNLLGRAYRLADLASTMIIGRFMMCLVPSDNYDRCRCALAAVVSGLGLSDDEANRLELEVIDEL